VRTWKTGVLILASVLVSLSCAAQDQGITGMDTGNLMGPRESCRQNHVFEESREKVWDAFWYAWDDLGLPSLPDQPGDEVDQRAFRMHATLHPGVSGDGWGPETACCDILVVDAAVTGDGARARVDLRLAVGYSLSECCDLDMPGYELEQAFFDAILKRLPVP
jgi:hypothetical protein